MQKIVRNLFKALFLLPIVLVLGCTAAASTPSNSVVPSPVLITKTRIAFSTRNSNHQSQGLFLVYSDGTDLKPISKNGFQPAWSPDGAQIAFRFELGSGEAIFVMNSDGSNSKQLTSQELPTHQSDPVWSPDGKRIALVAGNEDQSRFEPFDSIYVVGLGSQTIFQIHCQVLVACRNPSWSPDGRQIVFSAQQISVSGHPINIYITDVTGSGEPKLIQQNADTPIWQPHGDLIAFRTKGKDKEGVFLMHSNGEILRPVIADKDAEDMVWSPDGTRLAFVSTGDPIGPGEIYVIDADGSNLIRLTNSPRADFKLLYGLR